MPVLDDCSRVVKSQPHLQIPGFGESETAKSVCKALSFVGAAPGSRIDNLIASVRKSYWTRAAVQMAWTNYNPNTAINKAIAGGFEHVISVDNAAGYAELWNSGGNWYVVTGADPDNPSTVTLSKSPVFRVYEMPGFYKSMPMEEATRFFLGKLFGPSGIAKGGCGCGGKG